MTTFLPVLLFASCWSGSSGFADAATVTVLFEQAIASCPSGSAVTVTAKDPVPSNKLECAARCSLIQDDAVTPCRSFSFVGGVCVLSSSADCAAADAPAVFKKRIGANPAPTGGSAVYAGFVQTVGARQFWVFQQRRTGVVNFNRNWTQYERGFGDSNDFWSGLTAISNFIGSVGRTLRTEMVAFDGTFFVSEWSNFVVGGPETNYTMTYASYVTAASNTSGDSLFFHKNMQFSTLDRDNDRASSMSCALTWGGGFWFNNCLYFNAHGPYSAANQNGHSNYMSNMYAQNYKTLVEMRLMLQA